MALAEERLTTRPGIYMSLIGERKVKFIHLLTRVFFWCRAMHLMRGEFIAWSYTIALLEALFALREELLAKKTFDTLHSGYAQALTSQHGVMNKPKLCGGEPFHCEKSYSCFTEYSPKYTDKYTLKELVMKTDPPTKWRYVVHPIEKRQTDRIQPSDKEMRNHYNTREGPKAGELYLLVHIVSAEVGTVHVCWEGIEKNKPMTRLEYRFDLNVGSAALSPNYTYVPTGGRIAWEAKIDIHPCMALTNLPVGVHVLGLESKGGNAGVSHVITMS